MVQLFVMFQEQVYVLSLLNPYQQVVLQDDFDLVLIVASHRSILWTEFKFSYINILLLLLHFPLRICHSLKLTYHYILFLWLLIQCLSLTLVSEAHGGNSHVFLFTLCPYILIQCLKRTWTCGHDLKGMRGELRVGTNIYTLPCVK